MYLARTPSLLKPLMKELLWNMPADERKVYLTFDDGPIPEVTPWVLDTLAKYGAKGTFFCIGRNAEKNPMLMDRIRREGHSVGNHTYDHLNGWSTPVTAYLRNVLRCQQLTGSRLFRPPYGRITRPQVQALRKRFTVVMWDVLSGDFDTRIQGPACLRKVVEHSIPGSIIVFHDSLKAAERSRHALPLALEHFTEQGYAMEPLPETMFSPPGR